MSTETEQLIKQALAELEIEKANVTTTPHGVSVEFKRKDESDGGLFIRFDTPWREIIDRIKAESGTALTALAAKERRKAALEAELKALDEGE